MHAYASLNRFSFLDIRPYFLKMRTTRRPTRKSWKSIDRYHRCWKLLWKEKNAFNECHAFIKISSWKQNMVRSDTSGRLINKLVKKKGPTYFVTRLWSVCVSTLVRSICCVASTARLIQLHRLITTCEFNLREYFEGSEIPSLTFGTHSCGYTAKSRPQLLHNTFLRLHVQYCSGCTPFVWCIHRDNTASITRTMQLFSKVWLFDTSAAKITACKFSWTIQSKKKTLSRRQIGSDVRQHKNANNTECGAACACARRAQNLP